ncbi:secreted protein, putative [Ixodes scapularis]|uniref:Secreted protein, putative n=1 Tax=Ixodes scapularis TaxID=6945 RepID=B7PUX6_IXOSC|nr:secreted protein, putative [Ixodes scapularis]|eukprot:XP_002406934.1 secreted protein, putative [Ixodes scapularis]
MAADDHGAVEALSHRMVGFSDALDWRPLLFVEPVIAERACALCGVVCGTAVRLSCAHTLCPDCYAECVEQGRTCPLDQEPFSEDDLLRLDCSTSYLGKRRQLDMSINPNVQLGID